MAFMSQEKKKELAPAIKAALKKHGLKGTLSVYHYSSLILTITSGVIDFVECYNVKPKTYIGEYYKVERK